MGRGVCETRPIARSEPDWGWCVSAHRQASRPHASPRAHDRTGSHHPSATFLPPRSHSHYSGDRLRIVSYERFLRHDPVSILDCSVKAVIAHAADLRDIIFSLAFHNLFPIILIEPESWVFHSALTWCTADDPRQDARDVARAKSRYGCLLANL